MLDAIVLEDGELHFYASDRDYYNVADQALRSA
jgi:hypothetical protein